MKVYTTNTKRRYTIDISAFNAETGMWDRDYYHIEDMIEDTIRDTIDDDHESDLYGYVRITDESFRDLADWWKGEVESYNKHERSWFTCDGDVDADVIEDEYRRYPEICFHETEIES